MADEIRIWFDPEADFLEVRFNASPGYMRPTADDAVMKRIDREGNVIGFSILGVARYMK